MVNIVNSVNIEMGYLSTRMYVFCFQSIQLKITCIITRPFWFELDISKSL